MEILVVVLCQSQMEKEELKVFPTGIYCDAFGLFARKMFLVSFVDFFLSRKYSVTFVTIRRGCFMFLM